MSGTPIYDQLLEELGDPQKHIDACDQILQEADELIAKTLHPELPVPVIVQEETLELTEEDLKRLAEDF